MQIQGGATLIKDFAKSIMQWGGDILQTGKCYYDNNGGIVGFSSVSVRSARSFNLCTNLIFVTHSTADESEAQRGDMTGSTSHNQLEPDAGLKSPSDFSPGSRTLLCAAFD